MHLGCRVRYSLIILLFYDSGILVYSRLGGTVPKVRRFASVESPA